MPHDPARDDEVPPRRRFERLVMGPEPKIFRSVTPPPAGSAAPDEHEAAEETDQAPPEADPPARDESPPTGEAILERFETLKERLSGELGESAPPLRPAGEPRPAAAPPPSAAVTQRGNAPPGTSPIDPTSITNPVADEAPRTSPPGEPPAPETKLSGGPHTLPPTSERLSAAEPRGGAPTTEEPAGGSPLSPPVPSARRQPPEQPPSESTARETRSSRAPRSTPPNFEQRLSDELTAPDELEDRDLEEFAPDDDQLSQLEDREARRKARKDKRREKRQKRSFWKELPILVLVALVVAIIIKTFFFQAFYIPSGSMIPTLEVNDRVLVNKLSYRFGDIERGDILVFDSPEAVEQDRSLVTRVIRSVGEATGLMSPDTVLIKRVIGLPGETIEIVDNQVFVGGNPIAEPYLPSGTVTRDMEAITVPPDHVFMMGDNRTASRDSRFFGPIHKDDVVGRAFVTVWPPGRWGGL